MKILVYGEMNYDIVIYLAYYLALEQYSVMVVDKSKHSTILRSIQVDDREEYEYKGVIFSDKSAIAYDKYDYYILYEDRDSDNSADYALIITGITYDEIQEARDVIDDICTQYILVYRSYEVDKKFMRDIENESALDSANCIRRIYISTDAIDEQERVKLHYTGYEGMNHVSRRVKLAIQQIAYEIAGEHHNKKHIFSRREKGGRAYKDCFLE